MCSEISVFIIIFLFISNWFQIYSFIGLIIGPKVKTSLVDDKWIKKIVKKKTELKLLDIIIFHENRMYGMMVGLPFWPKMILSEGLYKNFNKDELEWVILHEAGHCVLWHNFQALAIQLAMISLGIFSIIKLKLSFLSSLFLSIILSLVCIQIIRWLIEYVADKYSISKVENSNGVVTAQQKLRENRYKNLFPFNNEKSILRYFLVWNIYPETRIKMANKRLSKI